MYTRYRPYSSSKRRSNGNVLAANQQRDITQVVLSNNVQVSCGQTYDYIYDPKYEEELIDVDETFWKDTGCAAINIYDVLRRSEFYSSYANMYDQVRIDSIEATITALNWVNGSNATTESQISEYLTPKSLEIVTAWDRSGLGEDQIFRSTIRDAPVFYCTIGKRIVNYSSAKTKHLGPGSAYEIKRYLYPSSLVEKSQFVNTSDLRQQYIRDNSNEYPYREFKWIKNEKGRRLANEFIVDTKYPTNLISDPKLTFKPTLLINVIAGPDPTTVNYYDEEIGINKIKPVTFNVEFKINVTFRGLRYNKVIN